jgi:dihydrolipoamide dehydrogenase
MPETLSFDIVIIGGGPAGYVGAIRAAQLGMKTACVERDQLGGICNNWGCIPTKALLAGAELYSKLKHEADDWGIQIDGLKHDWSKVIARSRNVAGMGAKGVAALFKKNKVTHIQGHAKIVSAGKLEVREVKDAKPTENLTHTITAKHIIIATGAGPRALPGTPFDGERVINYKEAMVLPRQPKKLLIVGAGAIGMEFAYFYNAFGTEVTVVEMLDRLLPIEDDEVSAAIAKSFKKQGITAYTSHKTESIATTKTGVKAVIAPAKPQTAEAGEKAQTAGGERITIEADKVLVAIGVQGNYAGLFDDKLGLATERGHIKAVPAKGYATNLPGVYAVGDVIGPPWLAHVASEEAIVCVELIAGHHPTPIDYGAIPGCTYCHPQVASIGLTERACKDKGIDYKVGKFPLLASGKARALGDTEGFIKLITESKYGQIIGCHMIGDHVTELIAEIGLAMRLEATAEEVIATIHAHPTISESVHESALGTQGRMIHF